ncbi:MAG: hypothetical protein LBG67_02205, partial [Campylobacteraceae bacterium]|nr:hypothetical protein [Campylobacteraceae bacterium]
MKKFLKFISLILICIFLYLICSMIPQTPLYRNNFSVENTAVVFGRIGRYDNQTVIGNLKINENGFYYLEVTDIPDYYFNEDGKMLIKVTRRGYEKPMLWNSQFQAYDRQVYLGNTKLIETEDYRLCTKAEVIELIDEGYEDKLAYIKRFKTKDTKYKEISEEEFKEYLKKYKSTINIRRFPQNGKYGDKGPYDGIIIFPKGKKPFLNFFHDMKISEANKEISEVNKGGSLSFGD